MPQPSAPRKGSLGFGPRTRAADEVPRIRTWPDTDGQPRLQGFAGYKAGMTHIVMINDEANSPIEGTEETVPVTIIETPPIRVAAVRAYEETPYGRQSIGEVWAADDVLDPALEDVLTLPTEGSDRETSISAAVDTDRVDDLVALTYTTPADVSAIPRKQPHLMETQIGGDSIEDRLAFADELLENGTVPISEVFRAGEYIDVSAVTKGKGLQGPVKRWGVQKRKGKHARQGYRRRIGNLGPWNPSRVRSTVPQQGQTGYHQRTELNKRILAIGDDEVSPDGGFVNYGEVSGPYILVKGSVPGPKKRVVRLRPAIRPGDQPRLDPEVRYVSTSSQQG